jgi:hypothetical protein
MKTIDLTRITDWKAFERLVADLLEVEGFHVLREPSVDSSGIDILAEETIISHSGFYHTVQWFVQCKHYAASGRNLARKELEQILYAFDVRPEAGLLIAVDCDVSEAGFRVLEQYAQRATAKQFIKVWNRRELENRLLRHPSLAEKYGLLTKPAPAFFPPFADVDTKGKRVLVISDTSPLSYQLFASINRANPNAQMLTLWQYSSPLLLKVFLDGAGATSFDLIIFFLGDTFRFPIPEPLIELLLKSTQAGKGVMLFPFFAWALHQGSYQALEELVPVRLAQAPNAQQAWLKTFRILPGGDLSWLNIEAFIENQPVTIRPDIEHPVLSGVEGDFGIIHTFEFLTPKEGAQCILSDNLGTPFLVLDERGGAPLAYVNSCTHNCLTTTPILSPFEVSEEYQRVMANTVLWCLGLLR